MSKGEPLFDDGRIILPGGRRLEAVWHGPPPSEAPTLVFLHEGLGCVQLWRNYPRALATAAGCGALVYSRPGYGASCPHPPPWPPDFMRREALETLPAVIAAAGVRKHILVGHSDGGSIALLYAAAARPPSLRGVIAEAAHVFVEDVTIASIREARNAYEDGALRRRLETYHARVDHAFRGWCGCWLDPGFRDWDIRPLLPGIRTPVLAIQGRDDPYGTPAQMTAIADGCRGPVETLLLDDCRHTPHRERRDAVLDRAARFAADCRED